MLRTVGRTMTWPMKWLALAAVDGLSLAKFIGITVQLGLLGLVMYQFELENRALTHYIMPLTLGGFVIHHFLPKAYRLTFFLLLSLAGFLLIFGLVNGAWLIGLGLALVGLCHLPIAFGGRVVILLLAAALLAFLRLEWVPVPWSTAIWPILGSIFMFRLIVYLYSLRHQKEPANPVQSLAYFFLLPNLVFPLFPVVDFNTFRRTYYNDERYRIYQTGIDWILRGVVQLILYRVVNYYLVLAPDEVSSIWQFVQFLVSNFLLYLRVSGQFHLSVGLLHLFGFNLPETHFLYFLSSSFSDFWRRINIYWKDFMLNHFYYPTMFRVRQWGTTTATVVSIVVVFVFTWFFHAYQWFWLRGSFLLVWQDVLFWAILGLFVVANALYEIRYGRKRSLGKQSWTLSRIALLALRTTATFTTICVLWSLWTSRSLAEWFLLLSVVELNVESIGSLLLALVGLYAIFFLVLLVMLRRDSNALEPRMGQPRAVFSFRTVMFNVALVLVLFEIGNPTFYTHFNGPLRTFISDLVDDRLGRRDAALLEKGYYEDLIGVNSFNSELWEVYSRRPQGWESFEKSEMVVPADDCLEYELRPLLNTIVYGTSVRINRWGMRDLEYEQSKPANTYRIALIGESHSMGWGVGDDETYEALLEARLNRELSRTTGLKYEILNFAVAGYTLPQKRIALEQKVLAFEPDAILYTAHDNEIERTAQQVTKCVLLGVEIPPEYLPTVEKSDLSQNIAAKSLTGLQLDMAKLIAEKQLQPYAAELTRESYDYIVERAQTEGITPIYVLLSTIPRNIPEDRAAMLREMASDAGFIVFDLSQVYEGQDRESLRLADFDSHPNAKGHVHLANVLYDLLVTNVLVQE
jgi:hypothetical protein